MLVQLLIKLWIILPFIGLISKWPFSINQSAKTVTFSKVLTHWIATVLLPFGAFIAMVHDV